VPIFGEKIQRRSKIYKREEGGVMEKSGILS